MQVAFLGLGRMGAAMASRLLAAGYTLRVYNRSAQRAAPLIALGALAASSAREACDGAHAIVSMLADDEASRAVWGGTDGALTASTASGAFAIECSTLSHAWVLQLARQAAARGLRYVDAPVTGLPEHAAAGELTLLVGSNVTDLKQARPLLQGLANRILHFGAVGSGTVYKLMINLLGAVQIASAAEALALAERAGLDLRDVVAAMALGQAASPQVVRNTQRMLAGDHAQAVVFTPQLRTKDVDYALQLAHQLGLGTPFGSCALQAYRALHALGLDQANESAIIEVARTQRPVQI